MLAELDQILASIVGDGDRTIFRTAVRLYRRCLRAYSAKAVDLAAIGCRAVLENGAYALLTHRRQGPSSHEHLPYGSPDRSAMFSPEEWEPYVPLDKMIRALRDRGVIEDSDVSSSFLVKDHGDGVAHFEARKDRENYRAIMRPHSGPYVVPLPSADEAGVLADLRITGEILIKMIRWDIEQGQIARTELNPGP